MNVGIQYVNLYNRYVIRMDDTWLQGNDRIAQHQCCRPWNSGRQ